MYANLYIIKCGSSLAVNLNVDVLAVGNAESGSIGHVCFVNNVPFAILRSISDNADEGATVDYPTFAKASADGYVKVISDFAENWCE